MKRLLLLPLVLFFLACSNQDSQRQKKIVIGFSQCTTGDDWRMTMHEEMLREMSLYRDYDISLIIKDAQDDNERQIQDIKELVAAGIDLLIVSPNEADPLTPIVEQVYEQGIPVIVIDRKINSEKFTAYVGANNLLTGKEAGRLAAELLNGKGKILEITGLTGSTPAIERSKGFRDILSQYPDITIEQVLEGAWLIEEAQRITDSVFAHPTDIDLVFAHNDPMAYGVYRSASKHGLSPYIIGVDGLNTPRGGLNNILNGYVSGTVLYPTGGDKAIQIAINILSEKPYDRFNYLKTAKIDPTHARTLKLQSDQIQEQQAKIDLQREYMGEMDYLINKQKNFLFLLVLIVLLLILLVGLIIYFLNKKNHINKILDAKNKTIEQQNKKITQQRDEVVRVLKIAEEATEMKLRFFTNISHEFRTSLSLISLPINDLVASEEKVIEKDKLLSIQKNTNRLIRLAEEILDFRKIDTHKYQLNTIHADMVKFMTEVVTAFQPKADRKRIHLHLHVPGSLVADFDPTIMEKVMFNLLSNAIKYTQQEGEIMVNVVLSNSRVTISVEDNGIGIPEHQIPYIFDIFHRAHANLHQQEEEGMGIGLSLTKELVHIHHGMLKVKSQVGQGTTFYFSIPQIQPKAMKAATHGEAGELSESDAQIKADKSKTVLIVEDNEELLEILASTIGQYFEVRTASNGKKALEIIALKQPHLVISDICMPAMDGIELCAEIKKNPLTFQIPVILLTAIDAQQSKINSFNIGADEYLTKPFNKHVLISRAKNLMESREKLKLSLGKYQFLSDSLKDIEQADQEFVQQCISIIHQHISDESFHLDHLADAMSMSRSSLYRKIKKLTDMRGVDFIKKVRLQYAAKLLLNEDIGVNEVAWLCGFSDVKYFSKCFAREFEHNPSKFKNAILSAKDIQDFVS